MKKRSVICYLARWRSPSNQYRMKTYSVPSLDQVTKWKSYKDRRPCPRSLSVNLVGRNGDLTNMDLYCLDCLKKSVSPIILCTVYAPCLAVSYPGTRHKEMKKEAAAIEQIIWQDMTMWISLKHEEFGKGSDIKSAVDGIACLWWQSCSPLLLKVFCWILPENCVFLNLL